MRVGEADGMRLDVFAATYGVPDYEREPYRPLAPGGESWAQFMLRVGTTLHRIAEEYDGKTVVIVCHGGVIDGSMICLFGLNTHALPAADLHTHNTSITHWERRTAPASPRAGGSLPTMMWRISATSARSSIPTGTTCAPSRSLARTRPPSPSRPSRNRDEAEQPHMAQSSRPQSETLFHVPLTPRADRHTIAITSQ